MHLRERWRGRGIKRGMFEDGERGGRVKDTYKEKGGRLKDRYI